jgi:hypothetical protein
VLYELDGCFEIVEETVNIGKQDFDMTASLQ